MILCANPSAQFSSYQSEIESAVISVMRGERYILGEEVEALEREFAAYIGASYAIGVANGTDALELALRALDIKNGDEVITVSHTAVATVAAIEASGATPVLVDVEQEFYTLEPSQLEEVYSSKTKAVIAVHIYGQSCDMDKIVDICKIKNLKLIEDCAQSVGSSYKGKKLGSIGDIGCFSFFPTKNLGALGDGGCLVCNNKNLAMKIKEFRQYGWDACRNTVKSGINSRLDELQAAILRVKLKKLDQDNAERNKQAEFYFDNLKYKNFLLPKIRIHSFHSFHLFVIQIDKRDELKEFLMINDIATGLHYSSPVHKMPGYASKVNLKITNQIYSKILSLPLYPGLKRTSQSFIVEKLHDFISVIKK